MVVRSREYLKNLSKVVSHALRHDPEKYGLELDEGGCVPTEKLLSALKESNCQWSTITESDLYDMIKESDKKRHEIQMGKIRALYGHSVQNKIEVKGSSLDI